MNRSDFMKIGALLRIDSRESIHANRPDSRCESPEPSEVSFSVGENLGFAWARPSSGAKKIKQNKSIEEVLGWQALEALEKEVSWCRDPCPERRP